MSYRKNCRGIRGENLPKPLVANLPCGNLYGERALLGIGARIGGFTEKWKSVEFCPLLYKTHIAVALLPSEGEVEMRHNNSWRERAGGQKMKHTYRIRTAADAGNNGRFTII